jgi:hypothetical protein
MVFNGRNFQEHFMRKKLCLLLVLGFSFCGGAYAQSDGSSNQPLSTDGLRGAFPNAGSETPTPDSGLRGVDNRSYTETPTPFSNADQGVNNNGTPMGKPTKPSKTKQSKLGGGGAVGGTAKAGKTAVGMTDRTAKTGVGLTDRAVKSTVGGSTKAVKEVFKAIF